MTQSDATPRQRRPIRRGRIIAGVAVVAVLAALGGGYALSQVAAKPAVATARASTGDLTVEVSAPGSVVATSSTSVYSPIAGTLASVQVTDGQAVKAGDVLATLDDASLRAAVEQARAQVAQADSQAKAAKASLANARAQRAAASAMPHETSAQTSARNAALSAADAAAESAVAAQDAAKAAQSAAASVRATAEANAAKAAITAPVAGTVGLPVIAITALDGTGPTASAGVSVTTAMPVFTIVDLTHVSFAAQVDEADVASVQAGARAAVSLDAFAARSFEGSVAEIATSSMTTKTGGTAYVVKVPLTPGDAALRLGMSGNISIAAQTVPGAILVPTQAVQSDGASHYVYKVTGGRVTRTVVTVGAASATQTQITSGLAAGDDVATTNLGSLSDGASVNVH